MSRFEHKLLPGQELVYRKRRREACKTHLVEQLLRKIDDFLTCPMIADQAKVTRNQASAALCHLRKYHAVDAVEVGNVLWWFITPNTDTRIYQVEQRIPEEPGTRRRRKAPGMGPIATALLSKGDA